MSTITEQSTYPNLTVNNLTVTGGYAGDGSELTNLDADNLASGTVPAARMPALTGDVTSTVNTVATTIASVQGTTVSGTTGTGNVVFSNSPTLSSPTVTTPTMSSPTISGTVGIGAAPSTAYAVRVSSTSLTGTDPIAFYANMTGAATATGSLTGYSTNMSTAASAYTVSNVFQIYAANTSLGAGSAITNQYGIYITDMTSGTNNYGLRSVVSSGSNKYNLYISGTADNYMAGKLGIGMSPTKTLDVTGTFRVSGIATFSTAPEISAISNTGTITLPTATTTLVGRDTTDTLTNKTLTAPVISTISNTGTLTLPTSTDTLVGRATTDTLTNKTLTSPTINSGALSGTFSGNFTASGVVTVSNTTESTTTATGAIVSSGGIASAKTVLGAAMAVPSTTNASTTTPENALSTSGTSNVRMTGAATITINGIANGAEGKLLILTNRTGNNMTITHNSASAAAGDKIFTAGSANKTISDGGVGMFYYDSNTSSGVWRMIVIS